MFGEVRALKDKLQKLATTFDRELLERDKALKKYQNGLWDEIQMMLKSVHEDAEITTKLCQNLVTQKADKKDLNETRQKLQGQLSECMA